MFETRETKLQVRLTNSEKELFSELAKNAGYSASSYLRRFIQAQLKDANFDLGSPVIKTDEEPNEKETDTVGITVRLRKSEKQALESLAHAMGMSQQRTLIAVLRSVSDDAALVTKEEMTSLLTTRNELQKIGVNLNQLTKAINAERKAGTFKASSIDVESLNRLTKQSKEQIENLSKEINRFMLAARTRCTLEVKTIEEVGKRG